MQSIVEILKSRGKLGAIGLMLIGLGHMIAVYFGKLSGDYQMGAGTFFLGLSLLGIRGAVEPPK